MTPSDFSSLFQALLRRHVGVALVSILMLSAFIGGAAWQDDVLASPADATWGAMASSAVPDMGLPGPMAVSASAVDLTQSPLPWMQPAVALSADPLRHVSVGLGVLTTGWLGLALMAFVLAGVQRSGADAVLGSSAVAWAIHGVLAARRWTELSMDDIDMPWMNILLLAAVASLVWYAGRLSRWRLYERPPFAVWPAWVAGLCIAAVVDWSRGGERFALRWTIALTCVAAAAVALTRLIAAEAPQRMTRRSWGVWWIAVFGSLAIGSGAFEIWLRVVSPQALVQRPGAWFVTRACILLLMVGLLCWRLVQMARVSTHLTRKHQQWRRRLHDTQLELDGGRRSIEWRDRADQLRSERDWAARDTLDDLSRELSPGAVPHDSEAALAAWREDAFHRVQWVRDSLDGAPQSLEQAFDAMRSRLEHRVRAAGGVLTWHADAQARGVVLSAGDTLMWQRLAVEAVSTALSLGWMRAPLRLALEVHEGETGRHLRLALRVTDPSVSLPSVGTDKDLFGAPADPAAAQARVRLQRLATALHAQIAFESRPGRPAGVELVKMLRQR